MDAVGEISSGGLRRLRSALPVHWENIACLAVARTLIDCDACVKACPVDALRTNETSLTLAEEGCLGCGRCQVACPTGALVVDGFESDFVEDAAYAAETRPVIVECGRVAARQMAAGARRVPCLGGLGVNHLLDMVSRAGTPVVFIDRGWCTSCPAGGEARPWATAAEAANEMLALAWPSMTEPVRTERRPLADSVARPIRSLRSTKPLSRRDLLTRLVAAATPAPSRSRHVGRPRTIEVPARRRRLELLTGIVSRCGGSLPSSLLPEVSVSESCRHHGVCATVCPTGSLRAFRDGRRVGLTFDSATCIECGACQSLCPERALRLSPQSDSHSLAGRVQIAAHESLECERCGGFVLAIAEATLCESCRRSADLAAALVSAIKGEAPRDAECDAGVWPAKRFVEIQDEGGAS